ncbi:MAG: MtrB/PioB family outer membrane beta-barrel protein, partial [Myxococcales bacterium]|nr:MtrB/PioB family outer membrane beta-barrel protein [Myxococcales bacterium]
MRGAVLVGVLVLAIENVAAGEPATGSGLDPAGLAGTHLIDERGMSLWRQTPRRSPTGLLYAYPWKPWDYRELDGGWLFRGFAEIGGIGSPADSDEAYFQEYVDLDDGVLIRNLVLDLRRPESGDYFEFDAGVVGRDDQFYRAELGRFGRFRLVGFFDGLRHQYANDARILHEGAGSDELRLPAPLIPGENTVGAIENALQDVGKRSIHVQRDSGGLRGEIELWRDLDLFAVFNSARGSRYAPCVEIVLGADHLGSLGAPQEFLDPPRMVPVMMRRQYPTEVQAFPLDEFRHRSSLGRIDHGAIARALTDQQPSVIIRQERHDLYLHRIP